MPVFANCPEVLGSVCRQAAASIVSIYAAVPALNRLAAELQDYHLRRPELTPLERERLDRHHHENQDELAELTEILIADSDRALGIL